MPPPAIYYIRHGQTEWNAEHRLQGQRDIPLNDAGRAEARRSGEILRDILVREGRSLRDLDYVSSPLVRASETMELVRIALGLHPAAYCTDPRLAEISFGQWEGLTLADLKSGAAEQLAAREQDPWRFTPPGGRELRRAKAADRSLASKPCARHCSLWPSQHRAGVNGASRACAARYGSAQPHRSGRGLYI
ncbi:MAG: hypothetical protein QOF19_3442 [Alphaproteobacteria bacterium]|jgi:probable phosphoglycerate mutase|nr:hypothetical protein [Alphaproteobacteria bacterium]